MVKPEDYGYLLPEKNLALSPAVPRDTSKLFIYDTVMDEIKFDYFYNLDKYLPENSFMVLNNTKVLPARIIMKKETGGKVVVLFLVNEIFGRVIPVMADRKINIGEKLYFENNTEVKVISQQENIFKLNFNFSREKLFSILEKYGTMPIPPYLKKSPLKRDELLEKYQTIFALKKGSSAAPTASLHFTEHIFNKLEKKGIEKHFITLHVGLGTFAPITDENIKEKKLHEEFFEIGKNTWEQIKINKEGPPSPRLRRVKKKLIAVGTTVTRTLESLNPKSEAQNPKQIQSSKNKIFGKTDLFIFPPYDFEMVDIMITNFHLPKSSLMMLVEAFLQFKYRSNPPTPRLRRGKERSLVELYNIAIKNNFRFYSFGDCMLII